VIKIADFNWNECYFMDCIEGMKLLPDKCIELGFADPPFNINLEMNVNQGKTFKEKKNDEIIYYIDDMNKIQYEKWCSMWLNEMMRVCSKVIVYCGNLNVNMFYRIRDPLDLDIYYVRFNDIITPTAWAGNYKPILVYADDKNCFLGRPKGKNCKFDCSVIVKNRKFFDKYEKQIREELKHPCPIDKELIYSIITQLKPKSVLDPFLGSGTTAEVCSQLKVSWVGFEIKIEYKVDIEKRIAFGKSHPMKFLSAMKSRSLDRWLT